MPKYIVNVVVTTDVPVKKKDLKPYVAESLQLNGNTPLGSGNAPSLDAVITKVAVRAIDED